MSATIAVLDDEEDILELLRIHLAQAGFQPETFADPEDFFKFMEKKIPDLVILDLMLPGTDGLEICRMFKGAGKWSCVPIIMLTARGDETDRVLGLELGADDYVAKPFSIKELIARVKAVLRRPLHQAPDEKIAVSPALELDLERRDAFLDGAKLDLTTTEFNILKFLASKKGRVFTREQLLDGLWGNDKIVIDRTIDVHIRNLRRKLGREAHVIQNVRGAGYRLES